MLDNFYIILVSPDESSNIAATCRAMKTMGFTNLRIACPKVYDENQIKYISLHAFDVYNNRQDFPSLGEALHDISIAAGTTSRIGKKRKYNIFTVEEFGNFILEKEYGKIAIIFGNEEHGLTGAELDCCNMSVHIPSSPDFPSLNLSHAVQVVTYSLYTKALLHKNQSAEKINQPKIDLPEIEELTAKITSSLKTMGFFKITDDKDIRTFLRDIFSRASINDIERDKLSDLFKKIEGLHKSKAGT
ncbi:MAG: TrmJ/YjtD family RNA methyltransferase [Spirochaetaceae bacterium]|nr:TrmJ/YjtD family RNA methyltransferase [Spirochaetaceae bacterium]